MSEKNYLDIQYNNQNSFYSIDSEALSIVIEQVNNCVCKILQKNGTGTAIGFLCKIPFPNVNNLFPVLILIIALYKKILLKKKYLN